jgi:hypothetical protein
MKRQDNETFERLYVENIEKYASFSIHNCFYSFFLCPSELFRICDNKKMSSKICIISFSEYNFDTEEGLAYDYDATHYRSTCCILAFSAMLSVSKSATKNKNKTAYCLLLYCSITLFSAVYSLH